MTVDKILDTIENKVQGLALVNRYEKDPEKHKVNEAIIDEYIEFYYGIVREIRKEEEFGPSF